MNIHSNIGKDQYTSRRQIAAWSEYSDPFMVVLSEQSQFLALEVIISRQASYRKGSRHNALLCAHGWTKSFFNSRQNGESKTLRGLTTYLSNNPKQMALLLKDVDHILISLEERVARLHNARKHFTDRGAVVMLNMIDCYLNAVRFVEDERRDDELMAAAPERNRLARMKRLVERVKMIKAQRNFIEVLDRVKVLLGMNAKATGKVDRLDLWHWRHLVSPLE